MKSKGRNRLLSLIICICIAFAFSSCVKNDLPYPVVRLSITGFEVNGQIGSAVINNEERTVTVDLLEFCGFEESDCHSFRLFGRG